MSRRLLAAVLLACGAPHARADAFPALRIGVLSFETADASVSGAAAGDLFSTDLYRGFPGLAIIERRQIEAALSNGSPPAAGLSDQDSAAKLRRLLGLGMMVSGNIMALDKSADGDGGTLVLGARLVKLDTGEILWADTRTVRIGTPWLKKMWGDRREADSILANKLLELGVFQLVEDLGKRLPEEALAPPRRPKSGADSGRCASPWFYEKVPRDDEWYYGVGKDPDTDRARIAALSNLVAQATGRVGGGESGRESGRASPDENAAEDRAGLLAGWEQDDFGRCDAISYVLVRIEKARVRSYLARREEERARPGADPAAGLDRRLALLDARSRRLQESPPDAPGPALAPVLVNDTVASVRALIGSGGGLDQVARANAASAEMIFSDLLGPKERCGAAKCPQGIALEQAAAVAAARRKIGAGTITMDEIVKIHAIFAYYSKADEERDFLDAVISRKLPAPPLAEAYDRTRELAFPWAWSAALRRDDWSRFFRYCSDYLRLYPNGLYAATAEKNRENAANLLMMRNDGLIALTSPAERTK
jgi:hypothetical protein